MSAPCADLVEGRPAQHPPARARVSLAFAFVIGIEQISETLVEGPVTRNMIAQDEGFEEPGRVRQMPFRGRGVGEGLDRRVGVAQRLGERKGQCTGLREPIRQRGRWLYRVAPGCQSTSPPFLAAT